ncbi:ATP-binding protein [Nocardioides sp. CER19]|uniref:ATP-binding protein n=1 Tax=Nocardioides sp. CER19 TaxID=3038538 RepID=UPI00244B02D1|nr:ATP-binding protein [Nocardioides sp. CER19]MDH2414569.1 ATP-binding protein [Nocardioides sp. CER19]
MRTYQDIDRHDLVDCAELGVSELVSNAILHGSDPIQVRVRGTASHPRIEVRDASVETPVLPAPLTLDHDDDLLLTFGRGLSIVSRCSKAWGAEIEADGKVVWFEPSDDIAEEGVDGTIRVLTPPAEKHVDADALDIVILGVPLKLYVGFQAHFRELRREVRLLALAHAVDYPLADDLSDLFTALEADLHSGIGLTEFLEAPAEGSAVADLTVRMPRSAAPTLQRFVSLLDLADEFCRQERLLSLARTDEQRAFQTWFLSEYVRQAAGGQPHPWPGLAEPARQHAQ